MEKVSRLEIRSDLRVLWSVSTIDPKKDVQPIERGARLEGKEQVDILEEYMFL
jgi:hypothetical protein